VTVIAASHLLPPGYHTQAPGVTAILLVLVAGVLIAIEVLRARDEEGTAEARRELMIAGAPLFIGSVLLVALRLVPLLG
jgi:uncharacterized membrane protein YgdD (TMEM256/DUF423 family)